MGFTLFSDSTREPAECVIEVGPGGQEITDLYPFLIEITVEVSRTEAAVATLTFETRRDEHGEWTVQDQEVLVPWASIAIKAAFGPRTEEVMRGYIRQVQVEMPEDAGGARVKVECQDDSLRLDRKHRRAAWGADAPTSDSVILTSILGDYGLSTHPDNAAGQSQLQVNQDETDIQFLKKRAEANGYELMFAEGSVYFGPFRLEATPQETITVYAGTSTNCLSFNASADAHQADSVAFDRPAEEGSESTEEVISPDLHVMGLTHADSGSSGLEPFTWKMSGEAGADLTRLQAMAQQKANDFDLHKIAAEGELDGTIYGHVLRAGLPVGVDGAGSWMSGIYYVDKVTHQFTFQGYRQRFTLLRNAYGDNLDAAGGLIGALAGLF